MLIPTELTEVNRGKATNGRKVSLDKTTLFSPEMRIKDKQMKISKMRG